MTLNVAIERLEDGSFFQLCTLSDPDFDLGAINGQRLVSIRYFMIFCPIFILHDMNQQNNKSSI